MQPNNKMPRSRQRTASKRAVFELRPERAFVLHLDARAQPPRRVAGRVEHVTSGTVAHVTSLRQLAAFLAAVLRKREPGRHGRTEDDRSGGTMMKRSGAKISLAMGLVIAAASAAGAAFPQFPIRRCGSDAVVAGTVCLDRYEASVWRVPDPTTTNVSLVRKIQLGTATRADLTAAGATQLGVAVDYMPCTDNGQNCANDIYALSLPLEVPSARITWFQAQEACANSGKRLPTNAEWQVGANGTPDPGPDNGTTDCNSNTGAVSPTGARGGCVSARGAFDMVGNVAEWVADWVPLSTACPNWGGFSDDSMCLAGASETGTGPGALLRGGGFSPSFLGGSTAGPLRVNGGFQPSGSTVFIGFRCVR